MSTQTSTAITRLHAVQKRVAALPAWYMALVLGLLALIPRCLTLNDFFTVDESFHWVWRVMHFTHAIEKERWAATNLTGHPGVTTLWLGSVGRAIAFAVGLRGPEWYNGGAIYLAWLRLPLVLVNSGGIAMGYLLMRQMHMLRADGAFLAGLLWAWSPFLIAHQRLLHLDGLVTTFVSLSVLLLVASVPTHTTTATAHPPQWGYIAASGLCAGVAWLTKAPSLLLLPFVGVWLLLACRTTQSLWHHITIVLSRYSVWLISGIAIYCVGWPAMWVEPLHAIGRVITEIVTNGGHPHDSGNYFLGAPVADPGVFFYPLVVLWRTTPVTLIGLLLLPLAWRHAPTQSRTQLLALVGFVLLYTVAMALLPKKFDRYLLPIWHSLLVLAAAGLIALADSVAHRHRIERVVPHAIVHGVVALILLASVVWYHPYYLAYFNPLLGGGATAQRVMLVGWGEGMEQVGAWLRQRPDLTHSPVVSWDPRTLEPFVPVRVVELSTTNLEQTASYAVLYARGLQRTPTDSVVQQVQSTPPLYTLHTYGIEYAAVYQPVRPYDTPRDVVFENGLRLRGFRSIAPNKHAGAEQQHYHTIAFSWSVEQAQEGGLFCFVHVLDYQNNRVAQIDAPIDEGLFATWQAGQQFGNPLPIAGMNTLPPGDYRVVLGVYRPQSGERLPVTHGTPLAPTIDGQNVILLTTITITESTTTR